MRSGFHPSLIAIVLASASAGTASGQAKSAARTGEQALFQDLPVVEAAALHTQTLQQAPASVTVITAKDIRRYGYRTLAQALASVRGFDLTYDRIYHYAGVRGFSSPGDYNTRFLVMLNGHPLSEIVYGSNNYFGQDFGLDMDLVQRIEVIRGPASALYGSNAILATVNVVTISPVDHRKWRTSTEIGSFGEKKVHASSAVYLGKGANLLVSGSFFHNSGQALYFPEFDTAPASGGWTSRSDAERGAHSFMNLIWRNWSFTGYLNSREKQPPVGWSESDLFAHRGNFVRDGRNFLMAAHTRDLGVTGHLRWHVAYDQYRYDDRFDQTAYDTIEDLRSASRGDWINSQVAYDFEIGGVGRLTAGAQAGIELRNLTRDFTVSPQFEELGRLDRTDRQVGIFVQQEWDITRRWKAYLGLRLDHALNFGGSLSPRLAMVYQRSPDTVYKFVFGRPFRNPSVFEKYYSDDRIFLPSLDLSPETALTYEISAERKLRRNLTAIINVYLYNINDLIEAGWTDAYLQQYRNAGSNRSTGVEFELTGEPVSWLEASASFAWQAAVRQESGVPLSNSPRRKGKFRFAVPVVSNRLYFSSGMQYVSARYSHNRDLLPAVLLSDLTVSTDRLHPNFDLQFGVRNVFDREFFDPVALVVDRMRQDKRSFFVKLICRSVE